MQYAFIKPAEAQAKNELKLLSKMRPAPVAAAARFDNNFLMASPIVILLVQAAA